MRGSTLLIVESLVGPRTEALLEIVDILFTAGIAGPLIITYWKATWALMDIYVFPNDRLQNAVWTAAFGIVFGLLLCFLQEFVKNKLNPKSGRVRYLILTRLYTIFAAIVNVAACKGVWNILDYVLSDTRSILYSTIASTLAVMALRTLRNVDSAPFTITVDTAEDYFEAPTFYRTSSRETALYILDCVFSVIVVGSLVVFVWRGSWALLDIFLLPEDQVTSFWTSLIMGYGLVVMTFAAQAPMRWAVAKLQGAPRLLLADVYHLISFFATVNVWRGIWGLLDVYFFPESPKLSNWCSHVVSLVLLILLNCSNSILVRGVYIDAEEPAGDCVEFPCHYLRLYFQKQRIKKRSKTLVETSSAANARKVEEASVPLQIPEEKV